MKPVSINLIAKRIRKVALAAPYKPVKGHGHERHEITHDRVFALLQKHAPTHCATATERAPINGFGKLGFVPHNYVSPELFAVVSANQADFEKLGSALDTVAAFNL